MTTHLTSSFTAGIQIDYAGQTHRFPIARSWDTPAAMLYANDDALLVVEAVPVAGGDSDLEYFERTFPLDATITLVPDPAEGDPYWFDVARAVRCAAVA